MIGQTLLEQAQAAIKARKLDEARRLLIECVRLNPGNEAAWMTLASVVTSADQAIDCLQRVLALNPDNATAREWLARAQDRQARHAAPAAPAPEPPPAEPEPTEAEPQEGAPAEIEDPEDRERPVPRLGRYLLDYKFITRAQLSAALEVQQQAAAAGQERRLGDILLEQGALSEERLSFAVREQHRSFYSLFDD